MKISQDKKKEIKSQLIQAAVDIFQEKGFTQATMREISEKAGLGQATIYNYFPSKEKILYGYFGEKQEQVNQTLDEVPDFESFTLKEKLQLQLETLLDIYLEDREFVMEAFKMVLDSPLRTFSELAPVKKIFTDRVKSFLHQAVKKSELSELTFPEFLANAYWDYCSVIILYWQKDESEGFTNTSRIIDLSLDLIVDILRTNIIAKTFDIISFEFKSHIFNNIESIHKIFSGPGEVARKIKKSLKKRGLPPEEKS